VRAAERAEGRPQRVGEADRLVDDRAKVVDDRVTGVQAVDHLTADIA